MTHHFRVMTVTYPLTMLNMTRLLSQPVPPSTTCSWQPRVDVDAIKEHELLQGWEGDNLRKERERRRIEHCTADVLDVLYLRVLVGWRNLTIITATRVVMLILLGASGLALAKPI